jgi:hypothetical protein
MKPETHDYKKAFFNLLNWIAPTHTSDCTDASPWNTFFSVKEETKEFRGKPVVTYRRMEKQCDCFRCFLLMARDEELPASVQLNIVEEHSYDEDRRENITEIKPLKEVEPEYEEQSVTTSKIVRRGVK